MHTFFLLGDENTGNFITADMQLTLLFVPTKYGTVTSTAAPIEQGQSALSFRVDSDEAPSQSATKRKGASTSDPSEETRQLLSQAKESQRAATDTTTDLKAIKAENAELRSRLERLEALFHNANFKPGVMTQPRKSGPGPK